MKNYPLYKHSDITSLRQLVDLLAADIPKQPAFRFRCGKQIVTVSYRQFQQDIDALAAFFHQQEFRRTKIAVLGENSYAWIVTYFAAAISGNIIVPLDKELSDGDIASLLKVSETPVLIHSGSYKDTASYLLEAAQIKAAFSMEDFPAMLQAGKALPGAGETPPETDEDSICALIFTSGTTGKPKGVMLT